MEEIAMENKVSFRTFTEKEFEQYIKLAIQDYANSLFKGGYSTKEKSYEDSTCQINELLPEGLKTRNNYFYVIENDLNEDVGIIWYAQDKEDGYVYDFLILEKFRRNGYAFKALYEIEKYAKDKGINKLKLQVFKYNKSAMNLYYKVGYVSVEDHGGSMIMQKCI